MFHCSVNVPECNQKICRWCWYGRNCFLCFLFARALWSVGKTCSCWRQLDRRKTQRPPRGRIFFLADIQLLNFWGMTNLVGKIKFCRKYIYSFTHVYLGGGFKYVCFHPYLAKWSNLTNMFQMGWNHQLVACLIYIQHAIWKVTV